MKKIKEVTTIIEDEVVYMVDPEVEFVSLVAHGAIRAPFKVFKNEIIKEELKMNKVIQAVLVRNNISDEVLAKSLEGIDRRNAKKYQSFTSYEQISPRRVVADTLIVQKHEEVDGIYFVLGDPVDEDKRGVIEMTVKEAVDYATMDNLYAELYAMADVIGGVMRQENAEMTFRKSTILQALDNFRAFAEVVLEKLELKGVAKAVNPEDHPTLVAEIIKTSPAEEPPVPPAEGNTNEPVVTPGGVSPLEGEVVPTLASVVESLSQSISQSLQGFGEKITEVLAGAVQEMKTQSELSLETVKALKSEVHNTILMTRTEKEEEEQKPPKGDVPSFKGTFFKSFSDFR